jgi:hypothetical protein
MGKYLVIFLLLCFGNIIISAQKNEIFSGDPEKYIDELNNYMRNLPGQYEDQFEEFIVGWEKDSLFNEDKRKSIASLSKLMISQNIRPYPHYISFLSCMVAFEKYQPNEKNYKNWIDGFEKIVEKKKTRLSEINNVLAFTNSLLRGNQLYNSSSAIWEVTNQNYTIESKKELVVEFPEVDLICYAKRDSIRLYKTSGKVYPVENRWEGSGGLVTWERGGYAVTDVFATIREYEIDLTKSEYFADRVTFTNKLYFDEPLEGVLHDKVKFNRNQEDATYPQFDSYTKEFNIPDFFENIDYEGGLSMQGAKLVGTGTRENTAKLSIYRNDTLVLVASSLFFGFRADRLSSQRTSVTIKLENDSIYHPDLVFTYRVNNRELTLLKSDNFTSQGPYFNSYHKVDMNFEQLTWKMNEDIMRFTAPRGAAIGEAYFESVNYFNYNRFINMMMMDNEHPLYLLKTFGQMYGSDEFPVEAYADFLQLPLTQVQQLAMRMAYGGFVFYDMNTGMITLKPRLYDYLAASINNIDYDVIAFSSGVNAPLENAIYDLKTNDLVINGIPEIHVSDSQNVTLYPRQNQIILKHNRNFQFDGVVRAGLLTFFGNNFFFSYDSFKINLQNVDSLQLDFLSGRHDNYGLPVIEQVRNQLQHITGEVLIDKADNKSGRESFPEYPIFKSKQNSYVYYEKPGIQNGVYESNDFFFEVYPFEMDSLDNFNYKNLNFKGEFVSAGIFPTFEKELSLQPDNSLGFRYKTPDEGFPVYNGKGTYTSDIWLSNKGLKGEGTLDYLTSTTWSHDFNFYPDSMNTRSDQYKVTRQTTETQYPVVNSVHSYIHWEPYADQMFAHRTDSSFRMFNDSTFLKGSLKLEPSGLSGWGRMDLSNSELESNLFTFRAFEINADTSDFFLKSLHTRGYTVLTENVNARIDYQLKKGWFRSNDDYTLVNFPENRYISYLDYYVWDMIRHELAMGSGTAGDAIDYTDENSEPEGPRYISIARDQDSLNFISPIAYYDYNKNFINARGVKFIEVADSRIYPDSGKVTIEPDAHMRTLERARIRTSKETKYHTIHTATLSIESSNYFSGFGNYDYINLNGDTQIIHFDEVKVDSGKQTIAEGDIYESAEFRLSPPFQFQGRVTLQSHDSLLTFRGGARIEHDCEQPVPDWLFFESRIDPNDIYIPVSEPAINIDREKIYAGLYMYYDSVHVYPAFLSGRKNYSDRPLVSSGGFLYHDRSQGFYKIGSKEKINDFTLPDNYLSLQPDACQLYGEGNLDLGENTGQLKLKAMGNAKHDITKNETVLDVFLMVDFFLDNAMINLMAAEIDSAIRLEATDFSRNVYKKAMISSVGEETLQKLSDELSLFGTIKNLPQELRHTIVFSELKLKWNDASNSYQSFGPIGIASIDNIQINKRVNGFIELQIKRSGDIMDFYLEIDRRTYYYFGYTRGVMQTLSSNRVFVETIMNMKARDRKMKVERGETSYIYMISTDRKKNNFIRRYQESLEGGANSEFEDE